MLKNHEVAIECAIILGLTMAVGSIWGAWGYRSLGCEAMIINCIDRPICGAAKPTRLFSLSAINI